MSIRFTDCIEEANAITHGGNFHADDVFSIVILEKVFKKLVIFRNMTQVIDEEKINPTAIVFDVGQGKFDHHQKDGNGYHVGIENSNVKSIPYASFGLLWKEYGIPICLKYVNGDPELATKLWNEIEYNLVLGVDAIDNGIFPSTPKVYEPFNVTGIPNIISLFNPIDDTSPASCIKSMTEAIRVAKFIFETKIKLALHNLGIANTHKQYTFVPIDAEKIFCKVLRKLIKPKTLTNVSNIQKFYIPSNSFEKLPVPKSSFGKLWEEKGREYCYSLHKDDKYPDYVWEFIRSQFVLSIDAMAKGLEITGNIGYQRYNILSVYDFINSLNCLIDSSESYKFYKSIALDLVNIIFKRFMLKALKRINDRPYVEEQILKSYSKDDGIYKHILLLDRHAHWNDWLSRSFEGKQIWFVISPSNRGGYEIHPVPCKYNPNGYRKGFPRKWHGLNTNQLQKVSKVATAKFVHDKKGFIGGADDLEGAINLCINSFSHSENIRNYNTTK